VSIAAAGPVDGGAVGWWLRAPAPALPDLGRDVADLLAGQTGMRTWYLGRHVGDAVLAVAVSTAATGIAVGEPLAWSQTVCRRMVSRLGPTVAPDLSQVANYARAPLADRLGMACYAGVPVLTSDGDLLGVLAGWDDEPRRPPPGTAELLWTFAKLLAPAWGVADAAAAADRARDARTASGHAAERLTGLPGRRGWGALLDSCDRSARRTGHAAGVLVADLGPVRSTRHLQRGVRAARDALPGVSVARLGPRRVGAVVVGDRTGALPDLAGRVTADLSSRGFTPRTAWATRADAGDLRGVWLVAEARLAERLRERPTSRGDDPDRPT
jgi:hypothetical protein